MEQNWKKEVVSWVKSFAIAFGVALILKFFIFDITPIENISMQPTLYASDRVFLDIISYKFTNPKHSEVVVFDSPIEKGSLYVKRVIGIPGDHIKIKDGKIYINDSLLVEDYLPEGIYTEGDIDIKIPDGMIFVMGDNRGQSTDSRVFGPVSISSVKGHALFRVYPFDTMKVL